MKPKRKNTVSDGAVTITTFEARYTEAENIAINCISENELMLVKRIEEWNYSHLLL